jgi:hypothetical protein
MADSWLCRQTCVLSLIMMGGPAESTVRDLIVVRSPAGAWYAVR